MKVTVDGVDLVEVSAMQKKVMEYEIPAEKLEADLKRRLLWVLDHKYQQIFARMKKEWEPKLIASGVKSLPTDKDAYAQLIFDHHDYKDRSTRDAESVIP